MTALKTLKSLCTPAFLYFILSLIAFIFMLGKVSMMTLLVKAFFILLWTWFLNFLCKKGYSSISWFLVLLPFILILMTVFFAMDASAFMMGGGGGGIEGFYGQSDCNRYCKTKSLSPGFYHNKFQSCLDDCNTK